MHGGQQLALFNSHAGGHCFQPIHIFEGNSGKPILSLLRPGKRPSGEEIERVLRLVIHRIRSHWPKVRILVRGDSHYCGAQVLALLRRLGCDYILGLAINPKLDAIAALWREQCASRKKPSRPKVRRFHQLTYRARSWAEPEKVIARVEATALGFSPRLVQLTAFVIAGTLAGIAGTLYAVFHGNAFPDYAGIGLTVDALVMVVLGGVKSFYGGVIGAVIYVLLRTFVSRAFTHWELIIGLILIAVVLVFPQGVAGLLQKLGLPRFAKTTAKTAGTAGEARS